MIDSTQAATCHSDIRSVKSFGMASASFLIGNIWIYSYVHVMKADTPILLPIDDMDRLGIYLNNLEDKLSHPKSGLFARIKRICGHPYINWKPHMVWFLHALEVRRPHRRFGHPPADKLINPLPHSKITDVGPETRRVLETIERSWSSYQT